MSTIEHIAAEAPTIVLSEDAEYRAALKKVEELADAEEGTVQQLMLLAYEAAIERYLAERS